MDIFKAIKDAGVVSSVFQRPQPKPKTFIEMAAAAPMAASPLFKFPGQKTDYAVPVRSSVPPAASATPLASSSTPAERAYQAEKARVAQLTAQDPELQRYEKARAAAKSQEEMNAARDIGMQIWAQRNPKLAAKVKPGQSGYEAIQNQINVGLMGAPADLPFAPDSLLSEGAMQSIPSYVGASDLQPVGTPLPATTFNTPENQLKSQMFNRFLSEQSQPPVGPPPTNPAEATYAGATNLQPAGDISLEAFSFNTPAEQRRAALFASLLGQANSR
ncbi:MAG: hypothetical protein EHM17_14795 [Verrucomicrobiaceae bacterium]|nr:MAG: hypothetical protein EHM17_14795 [Verrucomicrobiaceae bacterium]